MKLIYNTVYVNDEGLRTLSHGDFYRCLANNLKLALTSQAVVIDAFLEII